MSREAFIPTHIGWYWFCPIVAKLYDDGGIEIRGRWFWVLPVLTLVEYLDQCRITLTSMIDADYEPSFMFKLKRIHQ